MSATTTFDAELRPAPRPRRGGAWRAALVVLALLLVLVALAVGLAIKAIDLSPVTLTIDGDRILHGWELAQLPPAHQVVLATVIVLALLAALLVVPLALLLGALALAALLLAAVGLPLLLVALLAGVLLSPLWLLGWLVWRAAVG
jgi:hypothetical protein